LPTPRLAIIGAGIAGLTLATLLGGHADVVVIDKSRGVGGRMASRRVGEASFDHGAQFFTARSKAFQRFLQPWIERGTVKAWAPRVLTLEAGSKPYRRDWFEPHYVGVPAMTALPKALAAGLNLSLQAEVTKVEREAEAWWLTFADSSRAGPFDWVVATAPAPQILNWFPSVFNGLEALQHVRYAPCFALMLGFAELPELRFDAARVKSSPLDWIVRGGSKEGTVPQQTLLLHSTRAWAAEELEAESSIIVDNLCKALDNAIGIPLPLPEFSLLHRWRYASSVQTTSSAFELDLTNSLAACGDWSVFSDADNGGTRVESSFLSASALAERLLTLPGFRA